MLYLNIFETYKAQKEIEELADKINQKIAEKTFNWNRSEYGKKLDLSGKYWEREDFKPFDLINTKVRLKESIAGFTKHGLYMVSYSDDKIFRFHGYNKEFNHGEVELIWDKINLETFSGTFSGVTLAEIDNTFIELNKFVDTFLLNVEYGFRGMGLSVDKGYFKPKEIYSRIGGDIVVYLPDQVKKSIRVKAKESGELTKEILFFTLHSYTTKTLLHELQHAYDYYRSGGKAMDSQFKDTEYANDVRKREDMYQDKGKPTLDSNIDLNEKELNFLSNLNKKYLNFPHEVNARFTQAVKDTSFWDVDVDVENDKFIFIIKDINTAYKDFKRNMTNWNVLSPEHKKSLSRRFSQFWHFEKEYTEEKNKKEN
jgi:hypothetical protein